MAFQSDISFLHFLFLMCGVAKKTCSRISEFLLFSTFAFDSEINVCIKIIVYDNF